MYKFYLKAVSNAPKVAETLVTNKSIVARTNKTTLSYIAMEGATKHRVGFALCGKSYPGPNKNRSDASVYLLVRQHSIVADSLSRKGQILTTELTLNQQVGPQLWRLWVQPLIIYFEVGQNPRFSRHPIYVLS